MKVIFEDDANALTSKLFRAAYSDTSNFVYANGGSNIEAIIQGTVDKATNDWLPGIWDKDPNEMVYVYLDMIPANKSVKQTYIKLRSLARKNTDCLCGMHKHDCREATLVRKSIKLLSAYECVPSGSMATNKSPFNYDKLMDIHRQLVQDFNDFSDRLKSLDTRVNAGTYKHIMPID